MTSVMTGMSNCVHCHKLVSNGSGECPHCGEIAFLQKTVIDMSKIQTPQMSDLREELAALEHEQWAHWTEYMLNNLTPENIVHWIKQIDTPYAELSEKEKDSDREWADRSIKVLENAGHHVVADRVWEFYKTNGDMLPHKETRR